MENNKIGYKSEKREKIKQSLSKKGIKHNYSDTGRENLNKQLIGISKKLKEIIRSKIKIK